MKITKIRIDRLAVPLLHPYHLSQEYGTFSTATPVLVTLFTDEGITGYGECDPWPLFTGDSAELSALLLGERSQAFGAQGLIALALVCTGILVVNRGKKEE